MGQKVHPYGFRLGFNRGWHSNWIAKRDYADLLHEDLKLKKELKSRFAGAGVSHIDVERAAGPIETTLRSAIANATQKADQLNVAIDVDRLVISTATVDLGPTKYRRRVRPAPMGRAYRERRWQSHITIEVESEKEQ